MRQEKWCLSRLGTVTSNNNGNPSQCTIFPHFFTCPPSFPLTIFIEFHIGLIDS